MEGAVRVGSIGDWSHVELARVIRREIDRNTKKEAKNPNVNLTALLDVTIQYDADNNGTGSLIVKRGPTTVFSVNNAGVAAFTAAGSFAGLLTASAGISVAGAGMVLSGGITSSGTLTNTGKIQTSGANAGFQFDDRGGAGPSWFWYPSSGYARLFASSPGPGDILLLDNVANDNSTVRLSGPIPDGFGGMFIIRSGATAGAVTPAAIISNNLYYNGAAWARQSATWGGVMLYVTSGSQNGQANFYYLDSIGNPLTNVAQFPGAAGTGFAADFAGTIHASGYNTSSDKRFKKNVKTATSSLKKVLALRPVTYQWNDLFFDVDRLLPDYPRDKTELGLIAQEVMEVLPELVSTWTVSPHADKSREIDTDVEYHGVDYNKLTVVLLGAIQELAAKVADLERKQ